ncbi:MAG: ergothioneine biosynthesis protein EgtB [Ignavibacteriae bacterium]|nr:ergothioneine biosynthesis protein EgtB [Ignavibacteriota bacterium]MCB9216334.1 ergothioneine biosynthesis protein EgtB [Ignavibacteria bacterium]
MQTSTVESEANRLREKIEKDFAEARQRTLDLLEPLRQEDLYRQHNRLMSPIAWDVGHIGNFEELWGIRSLPNSGEVFPELDEMYDAVKNPRSVRDKLPLPDREELRSYLTQIRRAVLERLRSVDFSSETHPLLQDGFVYQMLLQHEYQHNETILQTLQLKLGDPYVPTLPLRSLPEENPEVKGMVDIPSGDFFMGTDQVSGVYDNERKRHRVHLPSYRIGIAPVTNGEFLEFVDAGGYRNRELWSAEGWAFVTESEIDAPKYWFRNSDGGWMTRSMAIVGPLNLRRPVIHVCWHEAEAYCRFVGMRLPTEAEWERAAAWDADREESLLFPWGNSPWSSERANLDMLGMMTAEVGAYPSGVSPVGCHQMIGDVWEWVSSDFTSYPGFEAFPYDEYSKIFFGTDYKVLRGGSWATRPGAIRNTFRNWDYPIRRQIFSGFRVASDT